jgi:hypothetical protein
MKIHKLNPTGDKIETIELEDCFESKIEGRFMMEINGKVYIFQENYFTIINEFFQNEH